MSPYRPTESAFQNTTMTPPSLPGQTNALPLEIVKINPQLDTILAATYFGGPYYLQFQSLAFDDAGNLYAGGYTAPYGLPTRTPFVEAFGPLAGTGFLSELSNDLTTLLFSSYLGNSLYFGVNGVTTGPNGSVIIGGGTGALGRTPVPAVTRTSGFPFAVGPLPVYVPGPGLIVLNSLSIPSTTPQLRIDSIQDAATQLDGPISAGEAIVIRGAGFGSDSQLTISGTTVPLISLSSTQITATVPSNLSGTEALVQVQSDGMSSNAVKVPLSASALAGPQ
jgi:hypothetical protein